MTDPLRVKGTETFREPTDDDVVVGNQIVGTDSDPNVRAEIMKRESAGGEGSDGGSSG